MPNAGLYLKKATVIYGFYLLEARSPELTVKVVKTRLLALVQLRTREQADYSTCERRYEIVEVQFVEMTGAAATKQASVTTLHVSVFW